MMLTDPQLRSFTNEVVASHFKDNTPLTDGVVKIAERADLNPEQVRRLTESVNNETFLRRFQNAEKQGEADRVVTFETADADAALSRLVDTAKTAMYQGRVAPKDSNDSGPLPRTHANTPAPLPPPRKEEVKEAQLNGHIIVRRLRKTAANLAAAMMEQREAYTSGLVQMTHHLVHHPDQFDTFEKDAFYHWGGDACPHLQLLRSALRKPQATYNHAQFTKVARVVDLNTVPMQQLQELHRNTSEIRRLNAGQEKVKQWLDQLKDFR